MKVEMLSIIFMIISLVGVVGLFFGLLLVLKLRYKMNATAFFIGCAVMFIFAFVLETKMHSFVLQGKLGMTIQSNIWLYALYAAAAAALF